MSNKEATARYKKTIKGVLTTLYGGAVQKSKRRNMHPPTYSCKDFVNKYHLDPVFIHLYETWVLSGFKTLLKPSIDRLDNSKSYTWDNIQLVDWNTNLLNNNKITQRIQNRKPVYQLHRTTHTIIAEYPSILVAAEATGANKSHISSLCRDYGKGKIIRKTSGGFRWKFKNE